MISLSQKQPKGSDPKQNLKIISSINLAPDMLCKMNNTSHLAPILLGQVNIMQPPKKTHVLKPVHLPFASSFLTWIFSWPETFDVSDGPSFGMDRMLSGAKVHAPSGDVSILRGRFQRGSKPSNRCPVPGVIQKVPFFGDGENVTSNVWG